MEYPIFFFSTSDDSEKNRFEVKHDAQNNSRGGDVLRLLGRLWKSARCSNSSEDDVAFTAMRSSPNNSRKSTPQSDD